MRNKNSARSSRFNFFAVFLMEGTAVILKISIFSNVFLVYFYSSRLTELMNLAWVESLGLFVVFS